MERKFIFCIGILVISPSIICAEVLYNVLDLGTLGGSYSYAFSINNLNQIVGSAAKQTNWSHACLYDSTGKGNNVDLGTLGGNNSSANSINNAGQIIGDADVGTVATRACLFDPTGNGVNINLGTFSSSHSYAYSINSSGTIVGQVGSADPHAYTFDSIGNNDIFLGSLGTDNGVAYSINDNGDIVGYAKARYGLQYSTRACLFDRTGNGYNIDLGTLGGNDSCAYSINNSNQIVGYSYVNSLYKHACLFDPLGNGNNLDLGTLGGDYSEAVSINNKGQIIGRATTLGSHGYIPCLFDPTGNGNNIAINSVIDSSSGWFISSVEDINDNGWIVGHGINPEGDVHACVLIPIPEPATLSLLALGAILAGRRRK
jgi:probable HAF family extracellular repeat protein